MSPQTDNQNPPSKYQQIMGDPPKIGPYDISLYDLDDELIDFRANVMGTLNHRDTIEFHESFGPWETEVTAHYVKVVGPEMIDYSKLYAPLSAHPGDSISVSVELFDPTFLR